MDTANNNDLLPVDEDASEVPADVQTAKDIKDLSAQVSRVEDALELLTVQDDTSSSSIVVLNDSQYEWLVRSLQMNNSLGLVIMLLLGILCGLSAWRAFVHSWGSHG